MVGYSIKDLEKVSGIKAHTIRIWEQRYGILEPVRTDTNIRTYCDQELRRILNVSFLNSNGYKISKIAKMKDSDMCQAVLTISETVSDFSTQIDSLVVSMVEMNEERFEQILNVNISNWGFDKTFINIIFPFLRKIGLLWQAEAVNPAQEHFMTCLIRQKLIVAIDSLPTNYDSNVPKFLLYLPEGEMHELGLLYLNYVVKTNKARSLYMGQTLPYEDYKKVIEIHNPDFVVSVMTYSINGFGIEEYVQLISSDFEGKQILLSGNAAIKHKAELNKFKKVTIFDEIEAFVKFIEDNS